MTDAFMITSQYRRFVEFSQYCEDNKHIGLCYGKPGVGKSESAMHYANWQTIEALIGKPAGSRKLPESIVTCKAAFLTPDVTITPKRLQSSISLLRNRFDALIDQAMDCYKPEARVADPSGRHLKLLIVDEADRLKFQCLELLRDFHDRGNMSIVLMGMPGIERRIKRFGQLHSRIHFAYEFLPLTSDEMRLFISQKWL